jgi:heme exporter protein D
MFEPAFQSFADFLAMGQYAEYVWLAYGLTALVFAGNLLACVVKRKRVLVQLQENYKRLEKQQAIKQSGLK